MVRLIIGSMANRFLQQKLFSTINSTKSYQINRFQQFSRSLMMSASMNDPPASLWSLGKLNHIAIACTDLKKASDFYRDILGAKVSEPVALAEHGVYTVFVNLGNTKIELLHPFGDKSPIQNFLDKNKGGGMHHICIEVKNIENAMADVKSKKVRCLSEKPTIGAHGKPVVFLHPKDCNGVLIELEEA